MATTKRRTAYNKEKTVERRMMILELIKGKDKTEVKDLAESVDSSVALTVRDIHELQKNNDEITFPKGAKFVYWMPVTKEEKPERYPDHMNNEGYKDPVAFAAIRKERTMDPKPNEAWEVSCSNGKTENYIVIAISADHKSATCIPQENYAEMTKIGSSDETCSPKIYTKPVKYFLRKLEAVSELKMDIVKKLIAEYLGLVSKIEVEKEVIKEVEVPVYLPASELSNYRSLDEVDKLLAEQKLKDFAQFDKALELANQKAEIYENVFKMLVRKGEY